MADILAYTWVCRKASPGVWPLENYGNSVPITILLLALKFAHRRLGCLTVSTYLTGVLHGLKGNDCEILKTETLCKC